MKAITRVPLGLILDQHAAYRYSSTTELSLSVMFRPYIKLMCRQTVVLPEAIF